MKRFLLMIVLCLGGFLGACQSDGETQEQEQAEANGTENVEKTPEEQRAEKTDLSGNTEEDVKKLKEIVPTSKDVKDVTARYEGYKQAILASDGKEAIKHVTQSSIDYYRDVLKWALNSSKSEIEKLDPVNQFMVLSVRERIPKEEIKKMTGKSLLIYTVDSEWTNKKTVTITELGEMRKDGDNRVKAVMTVRKENTDTVIEFERENEDADWKINLMSLSENVNGQLIRMANDRDEPVGDLIVDMIKQITGSSVSKDVWEPVN